MRSRLSPLLLLQFYELSTAQVKTYHNTWTWPFVTWVRGANTHFMFLILLELVSNRSLHSIPTLDTSSGWSRGWDVTTTFFTRQRDIYQRVETLQCWNDVEKLKSSDFQCLDVEKLDYTVLSESLTATETCLTNVELWPSKSFEYPWQDIYKT